MTTAIRIRPATTDDAPIISELLAQLGYPAPAAEIPDRLSRMAEHRHAAVFVAISGNAVVGLITSHMYPALHATAPVAYLTALVVDERHRGGSVGTQLAAHVEDWARKRGATRLAVTSALHRTATHGFYERRGYDRTGLRFVKQL